MPAPIRMSRMLAATTPLHTAAQVGEIELVKKLLAKGANPNATNYQTDCLRKAVVLSAARSADLHRSTSQRKRIM